LPRVSVGNNGSIRAHCASENQKKSAISSTSSLGTVNHASLALGIPLMGPDPNLYPTHMHTPQFWEHLGRAVRLSDFWKKFLEGQYLHSPQSENIPLKKLRKHAMHGFQNWSEH